MSEKINLAAVDFCRVCLSMNSDDSVAFSDKLSHRKVKSVTFLEAFVDCTGLESVHAQDRLCRGCSRKLKMCYIFIEKAKESDSRLKKCVEAETHEQDDGMMEAVEGTDDGEIDVEDKKYRISSIKCNEEAEIGIDACKLNDTEEVTQIDRDIDLLNVKEEQEDELSRNSVEVESDAEASINGSTSGVSCLWNDLNVNEDSSECKMDTSQRSKSKKEQKTTTDNGQIDCIEETSSVSSASKKKTTAKRKIKCGKCGMQFMTEGQLSYHRKTRCGKKNFKCEICHKTLSTTYQLEYHMKIHSDDRPFECKLCDKKFMRHQQLKTHLQRHIDAQPYGCPVCKKRYRIRRSLTLHLATHKGRIHAEMDEISFACDFCPREYQSKNRLEWHRKKSHADMLNKGLTHTSGVVDNSGLQSGENEDARAFGQETGTTNVERNYFCGICPEKFSTVNQLKEHAQAHTGDRPFECEFCGVRFSRWKAMDYHRRTHTGERPFKCKTCNKAFVMRSDLSKHMKYHMPRPLSCPACDKRFVRQGELKIHMRSHTGEQPHPCEFCEWGFKWKDDLARHMKQHHNEGLIEALEDAIEGEIETYFEVDETWEDGDNEVIMLAAKASYENDEDDTTVSIINLPNEEAEGEFDNFEEMFTHEEVDENLIASDVDEESLFSNKPDDIVIKDQQIDELNTVNDVKLVDSDMTLKAIKDSESDKPEKKFVCQVCGKIMTTIGQSRYHKQSQCGQKTFLCTVCPQVLTTREGLAAHIRTHTGERPFACKCCSRRFTRVAGLNDHMRIHTGERPYSCEFCDKSFAQHSTMRTHMKTTHIPRTICCPVCDKKYPRVHDLNVHMRSHTGEKPYTCAYCKKSYVQRGALNTHMYKVHPDKLIEEQKLEKTEKA